MTNSESLSALLNTDIPDPTDFHSPSLRQLDSALRCTICSECFDAPVTLTCGHCFCSLVSFRALAVLLFVVSNGMNCIDGIINGQCARNYINEKSECPSCRKTANEGHLR